MAFDLRLPLGGLFFLLGGLLLGYGLLRPAPTLGININAWWGAVLLVFGAGMGFPALRKRDPRT